MRGITLIPTFSHQGRRGYCQAMPGRAFLYSSAGNARGFLNTRLGNRQCVSLRNLKEQNPSLHRREPVSRKVQSALFPGFRRSPE